MRRLLRAFGHHAWVALQHYGTVMAGDHEARAALLADERSHGH